MGVDVCSDWVIDFFHSMTYYIFTMNKCGKVREGYNELADWMFPQFQAIKDTSVSFTMNNMLQVCIGKVGGFKRSYVVGTCGSSDYMVMNLTLGVLSDITPVSWNLREENSILPNLNIFKHCLYARRALQVENGVKSMIYPPNISAFVEDNNRQILMNFQV